MTHMKNTGDNNKGTMADIQAAKEAIDAEIAKAGGLTELKKNA